MKLWIANCTKQIKEVPYRLPGQRRLFEVKIPPGSQSSLPHDLTSDEIEYFIKQNRHYGLRDEKTVKNVKEHVGLLYAVDKQIDMGRVRAVRERNDEVLTDDVQKMQEQTLLASDHVVRERTGDQGKVNGVEIIETSGPEKSGKDLHHKKMGISGRRGSE